MPAKTKKTTSPRAPSHKHKPRGVSSKSFERVYWPYLPLLAIVSVLLFFSGSSGALQAAIANPTGQVLAYATSMSVGGLQSSTNSERAANGVGALSLNSKLNAAAQAKANDMASRNYWSHNTPEGNPPWVFIEAQGYSYQKLGENLAAGFSSESSTVAGWMASSPHRANLLDPAFTEVGFGFANNDNYTSAGGGPMTIVVAHYGKPTVLASAPPPSAPAASVKPDSSQAKAPASQPSAEPAPAPAETSAPPPASQPEAEEEPLSRALEQPFNTEGLTPGTELAAATSRIQTVLGSLPAASAATSLLVISGFAAMFAWVSKHALAVRRAVIAGETFAIRHPLVDMGLIVIVALSYLLTRTAGLIQ